MNPERQRKLFELFELAVDLPHHKRAAFVGHACGGDCSLQKELEAMLSMDRRFHKSLPAYQPEQAGIEAQTIVDQGVAPVPGGTPPGGAPIIPAMRAEAPMRGPAGQAHGRDGKPRHKRADTSQDRGGIAIQAGAIFRAGTQVGQYELIRELGRGGMGAVYLARDTVLGRRVAIKFLQNSETRFAERFIREAQATARCTHENIVVIHDVKEFHGNPYMVLEYLRGQTLSELMNAGKLPPGRAVQLMVPVIKALACAHEHKIVHRDLKPANIFMTDAGTIKVLDFGIAKFVYSMPDDTNAERAPASTIEQAVLQHPGLTHAGALLGTLPYMSPEQWGAAPVDHRTDLWAAGIMLYCMIVGRHPLAPLAGKQLMVTAVLDQAMPSAHNAGADIPYALADIIDLCLKKRKEERISSAKKLLAALEQLLPGHSAPEISAGETPYAGLNAFQEADASRFFGRARDIRALVARLHGAPLVAVAGPSGVGKSSFIRAGIIPALKQSGESWEAIVIRPGRHPMAALANIVAPMITGEASNITETIANQQSALQRLYQEPGHLGTVLRARAREQQQKILLFIDQFEELFTLTPDMSERLAFTACLTGMADDVLSPLRLIVSLRSDFLDRVAEDRQFMSELSQGLVFLAPPDRDGLREAIVRPAEMMRYRFETPHMVEHMLDTLQTTPGCLPLLQFAASKLWEARDTKRRLLTEQSYRSLGGVVGALSTHADAVLNTLPPRDQSLVRTIFLQLVTPERTRAIASVAELCELAEQPLEVQHLLQHLVDARLLVMQRGSSNSGATVEIVHESLIHSWPTLTHWLEENQEDAAYLENLRVAAKQWDAHGRSVDLLWRGETVQEARTWHRKYRGTLPTLQRQFLEAAFALAARSARIKRLAVAGTIVFLSLLVAAGAVALVSIREAEKEAQLQAQRAQDEARRAQNSERLARASEAKIQEQLHEIQRTRKEVEEKEGEINENKVTLAQKNKELQAALRTAEAATKKVQGLLKAEQERSRRLEERLSGLKRGGGLKN